MAFFAGPLALVSLSPAAHGAAPAATVTQDLSFTADDGVVLHATIGGAGGVSKRPLIIEDSPYAPGCCDTFAGPAYNYIELQWRGTGLSGGEWATTGERDQKDLSEFVGWACGQPWSDGRIGLYGFSASAIAVYNAMDLPLHCVKAAALMAGTIDLYRDLLYIGGINNTAPGLYVEGAVAAQWLANIPGRAQQQPVNPPGGAQGYINAPTQVQAHPTEDAFWTDRTFTTDRDHIPILADTGFYDVESRGPFLTYKATRQYGSHLLVIGAHDGFAGNTAGAFPEYARWFDHYVRGIDNGINREPSVSLYLSNGSHEQLVNGAFTHLSGSEWPLTGTQWTRLYLSPTASGTAHSLNDGSLSLQAVGSGAVQTYPFAPSDSLATDPHTVSTISGAGTHQVSLNGAAAAVPALTDMQVAEPVSLTYTTDPFATAVDVVGPASLDVFASSVTQTTDLATVLADVWPDGSAHPVATGQLRTAYPHFDTARSTIDKTTGDIVEPFTDYSSQDPAAMGTTREYHVEVLPIGNHFDAGHRLRLYVVGTSAAMQGATPGVNSLSIGGLTPSRLLLPTLGAPSFAPASGSVVGGFNGLPGTFTDGPTPLFLAIWLLLATATAAFLRIVLPPSSRKQLLSVDRLSAEV
jgi:predicted acyl esterase